MKFEIERGCFEFIKKKKRRQLLMTFAMLLIGILMFIVGLFMNKFERSNLLTMLAILMVLPATKYFVGFIVVFPYRYKRQSLEFLIKAYFESFNQIVVFSMFLNVCFKDWNKVENTIQFILLRGAQLNDPVKELTAGNLRNFRIDVNAIGKVYFNIIARTGWNHVGIHEKLESPCRFGR